MIVSSLGDECNATWTTSPCGSGDASWDARLGNHPAPNPDAFSFPPSPASLGAEYDGGVRRVLLLLLLPGCLGGRGWPPVQVARVPRSRHHDEVLEEVRKPAESRRSGGNASGNASCCSLRSRSDGGTAWLRAPLRARRKQALGARSARPCWRSVCGVAPLTVACRAAARLRIRACECGFSALSESARMMRGTGVCGAGAASSGTARRRRRAGPWPSSPSSISMSARLAAARCLTAMTIWLSRWRRFRLRSPQACRSDEPRRAWPGLVAPSFRAWWTSGTTVRKRRCRSRRSPRMEAMSAMAFSSTPQSSRRLERECHPEARQPERELRQFAHPCPAAHPCEALRSGGWEMS